MFFHMSWKKEEKKEIALESPWSRIKNKEKQVFKGVCVLGGGGGGGN